MAFALQLPPDLVSAVDPQVSLPHPFEVRHQFLFPLGSAAERGCIVLPGRMPPVGRWGDLQQPADRLAPILLAMPVHEGIHHLSRRSSFVWAKNALASLRISLARRSSRTSRSNSLTRLASAVVTPSRWPVSRSC